MDSALDADLAVAGGDLRDVLLNDIKACQYRVGFLVFGLCADDHALKLAAHRRDLTLNRANRFLDPGGVLT